MAPILRLLTSYGINFPPDYDEKTMAKIFSQKIDVHQLVKDHKLLSFQYRVYCAKLELDLACKSKSEAELIQQIKTALKVAGLLEHIYHHYLNDWHESESLLAEQHISRNRLINLDYHPEKDDGFNASISKTIREMTAHANFPRFLILRMRRLLIVARPLMIDFVRYCYLIERMEQFTTPVITYFAWIYFIPRLSTNLFLTAKHLLPVAAWMSHEEQALGWKTRLTAQFDRCWFELGNDIAALTIGLLNCFVFTGSLAAVNPYAGAALMAFDVGFACLRVYIEISRLKNIETQYIQMLAKEAPNSDDHQQIESYLEHMGLRIAYEQKRLYLSVINASILCLAVALALPVFASNLAFPLMGAVLSVLATVIFYKAFKWVDQQKPVDKVTYAPKKQPSIVPHSMFRPVCVDQGALFADSESMLTPRNV